MAYMLVSSKKCKICFYLGNTLILITGIIVLALGIWLVVQHSSTINEVLPEYSVRGIGILFIVLGVCIIIVALIAYFAAIRNHRCLMVALITINIILFFTMLVGALICLFYMKQDSSIVTRKLFLKLVKCYNRRGHERFTQRVDEMQHYHGCCGACDFRDWFRSIPWQSSQTSPNEIVPLSCCIDLHMGCNHRSPYAERPEQLYSLYHMKNLGF